MTRRKFIKKLLKASSALISSGFWLAGKAAPRKFVRAIQAKKYPGSLMPMQDISKQSKWGG